MTKISIVGAGRVGSTTAFALRDLADEIVLIDVLCDLAKGEALDISHCCGAKVVGDGDPSLISKSDLVIITAGKGRLPSQTRASLLPINKDIVSSVSQNIAKYAPKSKILVVTNPVDIMTYVAHKESGFKAQHVFGQGNYVDSLRFRYFLSQASGAPVSKITALVVGPHDENMVPLTKSIHGAELSEKKLKEVIKRTKTASQQIIELKSATNFAPAVAVSQIASAVIKDTKEILPTSVFLKEHGIYIGALARLGKNGVEEVIIPEMADAERAEFERQIYKIKKTVAVL